MTALATRFDLQQSVIQAPLAGGGDTPALVAAVSEAGGLGSIGAAYLTPEAIAEAGAAVRAATDRPFAINLFAPVETPPPQPAEAAIARALPFFERLGLPRPAAPQGGGFVLEDQFEAALTTGARLFSFTFGLMPAGYMRRARDAGMAIAGTATTVGEARALAEAGCDMVIAQGAEAGGHRGSFAQDFETAMIGTMALVPAMVDAVDIPVIASGGIMDGRGIAAALALGAAGVQMGTAFLSCPEAGIPEAYKQRLAGGDGARTRVTRAFSGRPARGLANGFMDHVDAAPESILPFPYQNALTRPLRAAAARQGDAEALSLWAGQGVGLSRGEPAGELMARLAAETAAARRRLAAA